MKVRLGYVALSKALDDVTTSSTITYTNYINKNYNTSKLLEITKNNLDSLYEIIKYNVKNNFHFYRLTSKLVPLATHDKVDFDYIDSKFLKIRKIAMFNYSDLMDLLEEKRLERRLTADKEILRKVMKR